VLIRNPMSRLRFAPLDMTRGLIVCVTHKRAVHSWRTFEPGGPYFLPFFVGWNGHHAFPSLLFSLFAVDASVAVV